MTDGGVTLLAMTKEGLKTDIGVDSDSFAHVDNQSAIIGNGLQVPTLGDDGKGESEGGPHTTV